MRNRKLKIASILGLCLFGGATLASSPALASDGQFLRVHGGGHRLHIPELYLGYYVPRFYFDLGHASRHHGRHSHRGRHGHRDDHGRRGRGERGHHRFDPPRSHSRGGRSPRRDRTHY